MRELKIDGYRTTTEQVERGDVAVVIRQDGDVQLLINEANADGTDPSANTEDLLTGYALMLLLGDSNLMDTARETVFRQIQQSMLARSVN